MTFVAVFTVEHQGRKKLLFVGCCLMLVALVILSMAASTSGINHFWSTSVIMVAMFIYIGGYQIGFGTMIWLITIEVFPASIRGPAVALSVQTNFAMHALVEMLVPLLQARFGISVVFGIFGIISASAIAFVWLCIPETKGLSLEEVEDEFARSSEDHMQEELHLIDRHIPARVSAESSTMTLS